jgi:hypothetical protein
MINDSNKIKFMIIPDGDPIEQEGWPLFGKEKFPNYEVFWANFVAPRTNRNTNKRNFWFKKEIPINEREIANIHYSIYKHFVYIFKNINNLKNDRSASDIFDNIFIRLGSIIDLTEEFLIRWLTYIEKINADELLESLKIEHKLSNKEIIKQIKQYRNISIKIKTKMDIVKDAMPEYLTIIKEFETEARKIKKYRNIIIHSWRFFQLNNLVLKESSLMKSEFRDWSNNVDTYIKMNQQEKNKFISDHFIDMHDFANSEINKLIKTINNIWTILVPQIPEYIIQCSENPIDVINNNILNSSSASSMFDSTYRTTTSGTMQLPINEYASDGIHRDDK